MGLGMVALMVGMMVLMFGAIIWGVVSGWIRRPDGRRASRARRPGRPL